jgi:tetratricopeptide (TPR) repeat protein
MQANVAAFFSDKYSREPGAQEAYNRLQSLKKRIEEDKQLNPRVRHYHVDYKNQRITGLEDWGRQVLVDLWQELEEATRERTKNIDSSWQGQERRFLENFIELHSRYFVGREKLLKQLHDIALSQAGNETWSICIQGQAGSGKSALFSKFKRELEKKNCLILCHAAGISLQSNYIDSIISCWIQELALHLKIEDDNPSKNIGKFEEKQKLFSELLFRASKSKRVVCLIDALNQFERSAIARHLTWLPRLWPPNSRLIVTAIPGQETSVLSQRNGVELIDLPKLKQSEADNIIKILAGRYHKTLNLKIIQELTQKKLPDNSPAYGNPLWLHLALEHLLVLDEDDYKEASRLSGTDEQKLHSFMLDTVRNFPSDIENLYSSLLKRAHERFGKRLNIDWISSMLDLIGASRYGLRESDIKNLLKKQDDPNFDLQFALVRRYLRSHLIQHLEHGQWDFAHDQMRICLCEGKLAKPYYKKCHINISNYFQTLPLNDHLRQTEIMYHYMEADNKEQAAKYYTSNLNPTETIAASKVLASSIIRGESQKSNNGLIWLKNIIKICFKKIKKKESIINLCNKIHWDLLEELESQSANIETMLSLLQTLLKYLKPLSMSNSTQTDLSCALINCLSDISLLHFRSGKIWSAIEYASRVVNLSENLYQKKILSPAEYINAYNNLATWYCHSNQPEQAKKYYLKIQKTIKELLKQQPQNIENKKSLANNYYCLGDFYKQIAQWDESLQSYQKAIKIYKKLSQEDSESEVITYGLSLCYNNLGNLYTKIEKPQDALKFCLKSREIREELCNTNPDNKEYLRTLGVTYDRLGDIYSELDQILIAKDFYKMSNNISDNLCQNIPDSTQYLRDKAASLFKLGHIFFNSDEISNAFDYYKESAIIFKSLCKIAPKNTQYMRDLWNCNYYMGNLYLQMDEINMALDCYLDNYVLDKEFLKLFPDDKNIDRYYAITCDLLGDLYFFQLKNNLAQDYYKQSLNKRKYNFKRYPNDVEVCRDIIVSYSKLGNFHHRFGNSQEKMSNFDKCRKMIFYMKDHKMIIDNQIENILEQINKLFI